MHGDSSSERVDVGAVGTQRQGRITGDILGRRPEGYGVIEAARLVAAFTLVAAGVTGVALLVGLLASAGIWSALGAGLLGARDALLASAPMVLVPPLLIVTAFAAISTEPFERRFPRVTGIAMSRASRLAVVACLGILGVVALAFTWAWMSR